jgi:hypothetical protein
LISKLSFSGEDNANPYTHLREFEQHCVCLHIEGMTDNTIRWKYFPFSLTGKAKQWYYSNVRSVKGDWGTLSSEFCLRYFPISKVTSLREKILKFKQLEEEPLGASWERFNALITTGPDLGLPGPLLLQHFYIGLQKDGRKSLDLASRGSFIYLTGREATLTLDRICGYSASASIFHKEEPSFDKEESSSKSSSDDEEDEDSSFDDEEVLIAKLQQFQSQNLAISSEPSVSQNPPKEEEIPPLENTLELKDILSDFGETINSCPLKSPHSENDLHSLEEESLSTYPHKGHWEKPKDNKPENTIEGEQSFLEDNLFSSPSMSNQYDISEPIIDPILDPNESPSVFELYDSLKNSLRQMGIHWDQGWVQ